MALVTQTAAQDREAVVVGVMGVFGELGVTAEDLRQWAPWCAALGELADAMDAADQKEQPAVVSQHHDRPGDHSRFTERKSFP